MPLIETLQKKILFEEAARKGLQGGNLFSVGEIYENLLSPTDIGKQTYGSPLAPIYVAKAGEVINVKRIANFFKGIARDVRTTQFALDTLESQLLLLNLEYWLKMQLVKNRALDTQKKAESEKYRSAFGATWVFTETFNNVDNLDLNQTTAAFDTSEGIAFISNAASEQLLKQHDITCSDLKLCTGGNTLGSNYTQCIDGLLNTSFRCLFIDDSKTSFILNFNTSYNLGSITIDPIGYGIDVQIETFTDRWVIAATLGIFNKTTLPLNVKTNKVRISFKLADSTPPKAGGIREVTFTTNDSSERAVIYSKALKALESFKEVKLEYRSTETSDSNINFYYASASGGSWTKFTPSTWNAIAEGSKLYRRVPITNASPADAYRGLYGISIGSQLPLSAKDGLMDVGKNQIEVSAVRQDWLETGDNLKVLSGPDFADFKILKAWSNIPSLSINPDSYVFQNYGATTLRDNGIYRGGPVFAFQRSVAAGLATTSELAGKYKSLCLTPLPGNGSNIAQYSHSYRLRFMAYAPNSLYFKDGRIWFLQGYKATNTKPYSQLNRIFGTYSFYINDVLISADSQPYTIYQDNSIEGGGSVGKPFAFSLEAGWNKIEIFINTVDPAIYGSDAFDSTYPYLQLEIFPSLFDSNFTSLSTSNITNILASGQHEPVSEFDLLWNLPEDPTYWAWNSDRTSLMYNTNSTRTIDSYFTGLGPDNYISYQATDSSGLNELYVRADLEKGAGSSPILKDYTIYGR